VTDFGAVSAGPAATPAPPLRRVRAGRALAPYGLLLPAGIVIGGILGYPLYLLVSLSFQHYGLFQLIQHKGEWIGLDNYRTIVHDHEFWTVLLRTLLFTAACVTGTMVLGTLVALLLVRVSRVVRWLLTMALVLAWAMPVPVAANIWYWMVDYEFGVANWFLSALGFGGFRHHDWFVNPWQGWGVIVTLIVWGAIPFVAITLYAGLSQVPQELLQAAAIDGARPWRVFKDITVPMLKPILVILTSLSVIWDFQVFTQVWILRDERPTSDYFLTGIYAFEQSFDVSQYGYGSAIALAMVAIMLVVTFVYIRQMVRIGEVE
jgi:N,N'-diacetylchitobiose transport system permease protein